MADQTSKAGVTAAAAGAQPGDEGDHKVLPFPPTPNARAKRPRDRRIDVFRGLALVMIFINHVPGTIFEHLTSRNFGFSDAAEGFVFIAGTSAALAYGEALRQPRLWPGISRIWGRAWTLYLVHLLITAWVIGIAAATLRLGGDPTLFIKDNVQYLFDDLTGVLVGIPILTHQIGYVNILPMYSVLLLVCPFILMAAQRSPRLALMLSVGIWVVAGLLHLDLPNFPTQGGWFLNPLSWQLLFVLGILTGLALRRGERFVAVRPVLVWLSVFMLGLSLVWVKWPALANFGNAKLGEAAAAGVPGLLRDFDKTYLTIPRLFHALSLIYLLSVIGAVKDLCNSRYCEPLAVMGRNALPVFALGTILSFAARAAKALGEASVTLDSIVIAGGVVFLWAFALILERARAAARMT